jgi:hypothetical protein
LRGVFLPQHSGRASLLAAIIGRKDVAGIAGRRKSNGGKKCGFIPSLPQISRDERQMNGCCKKLFGQTP